MGGFLGRLGNLAGIFCGEIAANQRSTGSDQEKSK